MLKKLQKCYDLYNKKYLNRKYTIQFSNNEEIDFEILSKNLCHMLGIDYKNLMSDVFDYYRENILRMNDNERTSSYEVLSRFIENSDRVIDFDRQDMSCFALNYYKVGIKCDIFSKLADLSDFNYGCINFDKDIFNKENPDFNFTPNSTKFLYTSSDEVVSPYFMMGLKEDENNNFSESGLYIVETLMAADEPIRFFKGQEVVIPTQIMTDDSGILDKRIASSAEKIKLLREYQFIVNEYGIDSAINIFGDYFSMLMSDMASKEAEQKLILN